MQRLSPELAAIEEVCVKGIKWGREARASRPLSPPPEGPELLLLAQDPNPVKIAHRNPFELAAITDGVFLQNGDWGLSG
ncbi:MULTISPECIES: hypothetical protein [Qipengyuania]|uniref:Uncharacterized protein n=1 Tax=Qipengyuania soli TaxID=2782568 RepID=A0A7S8F4N2_9SPHN|nr:hypothetical protein [Qipengyuania soli]QPC99037.1 hypothetical protein IRL76_00135 [Qipengyuania soli]